MRLRISLTASALVLSLGVTGCTNTGNVGLCVENTALCILGGVAVVGLGIWAISEIDDDDDDSPSSPGLSNFTSDLRLKRDVREFRTMPNGVTLFTFRYWNDERTFVGAIAQDLLKDERFHHAVSVGDHGYFVVDYRALQLGIPEADIPLYVEASRRAVEHRAHP
jgi:hypothetical protein